MIGARQVAEGQDNWGEEDHSDLLADGLMNGLLGQTDLLKDFKAICVLQAFRNLLVVDGQG